MLGLLLSAEPFERVVDKPLDEVQVPNGYRVEGLGDVEDLVGLADLVQGVVLVNRVARVGGPLVEVVGGTPEHHAQALGLLQVEPADLVLIDLGGKLIREPRPTQVGEWAFNGSGLENPLEVVV